MVFTISGTFNSAVSEFGQVDICVNNAGIVDENNVERCIAVNQVGNIGTKFCFH